MEKDQKAPLRFVDCNILQFDEGGIAERLWFLFREKYLDIFVRDCEVLLKVGFDLSALSNLRKYPNDFAVEYSSMKRLLEIAAKDTELAKSSNEGWKVIDIDEKCIIAVRSKGTVVQLKSRGTVDLNIKHICCAAYQIKNYPECIPFCQQAKDIVEPSRLQKVGFLRLSIPIPFIKDRSVLIRGLGYRLSNRPDYIHIFAEGINEQKQYLRRVNIDPKDYMKNRQLLDLKHCVIEVKCLGPKLIQFCAAATVDHHISFIPQSLVVFVVKQMGKFILNNMLFKLRNFETSAWAKQIKENYHQNKEFYQWIDNIVEQIVSSRNTQQK